MRTNLDNRLVKASRVKSSQGGDSDRVTNGRMPISLAEACATRKGDLQGGEWRGMASARLNGKALGSVCGPRKMIQTHIQSGNYFPG